MNEYLLIERLEQLRRDITAHIERMYTMPRGIKRMNNGPVDVPASPVQEEMAMPEVPVNKAYRSQGKDTPAVPDRPFGPGADYARKAWHTRLFDPANGATYQLAVTDVELPIFQHMVDQACEQGLVPCTSPDAPKQVQTRVSEPDDDDVMENDRAEGRKARRSRDVTLTFGQYEGKTIRQVYNSGKRGESYVSWLAENARDRDVRNAARDILE